MQPRRDRHRTFAVHVLFRATASVLRLQLVGQVPEEVEHLGQLVDHGAGDSTPAIAGAEEHQVVEVLHLLEPDPGTRPEGPVAVGLGLHVVRDQAPRFVR